MSILNYRQERLHIKLPNHKLEDECDYKYKKAVARRERAYKRKLEGIGVIFD